MHLVTFHEVMGLCSSANTGTASYRQMLSQVILELFWSQICWELPVTDKAPSILAIQGCRCVPKNMFGNDPPQMVTLVPNNLNISFQGLAAWFRVKIYKPVTLSRCFFCRFFRRQQQRQGLGSQDGVQVTTTVTNASFDRQKGHCWNRPNFRNHKQIHEWMLKWLTIEWHDNSWMAGGSNFDSFWKYQGHIKDHDSWRFHWRRLSGQYIGIDFKHSI